MGLITYDEIPVGLPELDLHILVAAQFVQPRNEEGDFLESVSCSCSLKTIIGQDLKGEVLDSAVKGDTRCRFVFYLPN